MECIPPNLILYSLEYYAWIDRWLACVPLAYRKSSFGRQLLLVECADWRPYIPVHAEPDLERYLYLAPRLPEYGIERSSEQPVSVNVFVPLVRDAIEVQPIPSGSLANWIEGQVASSDIFDSMRLEIEKEWQAEREQMKARGLGGGHS